MKEHLLSVFLLAGSAVAASAQSSAIAPGTNPNPDAPVNVSAPGMRPAQPATYSASEVPSHIRTGQFYVKDDKPATSDGQIITFPTEPQPSKADMLRKANATQPAGAAKAKTSSTTGSKPAAKKSSK